MSTTPRRLSQYELLQSLGRGHVGEVWKARDLARHRDVAIKIFHADFQRAEPHFLTNLTNEGQALTQLHHTNIVPVYEIKVTRQAPSPETTAYIVSNYIEGTTLTNYLAATSHRGNFPSLTETVYLFTSIGVAIDYAHQQGIIHGNLKPNNVLLNKQDNANFKAGEPLLTDFGLAQLAGRSGESTSSPYYISPEQAQGYPPTPRSDVYALGVMLYEFCTGILPFRDESSVAVMMKHIHSLPTPPILINPAISPALSEVILRAMAKDPNNRFPMASLLAAAIADASSLQSTLYIGEQAGEQLPVQPLPGDTSLEASGPTPAILGVAQPTSRPLPAVLPNNARSRPLPEQPAAQQSLPGTTTSSGNLSQPAAEQKTLRPNRSGLPSLPGIAGARGRSPIPPIAAANTPAKEEVATNQAALSETPTQAFTTPAQQSGPAPASTPAQGSRPARQEIPREIVTPLPQPIVMPPVVPPPPPASPPGPPGSATPPPSLISKIRTTYKQSPVMTIVAAVLILVIVLGASLSGILLLNRSSGQENIPVSSINGRFYLQDHALGRHSQIRIEFSQIPAPEQGQQYFVWLLENDQDVRPLGSMPVENNKASFLYGGDDNHTNLLSVLQGIIITQELSNRAPATPSEIRIAEAIYPETTLERLRALLEKTPEISDKDGVVVTILEKIRLMNDKISSINDSLKYDEGLVIRQASRVIDALVGTEYAAASGDRPSNVPSYANEPIGLLSSPSTPGYIDIMASYLEELKQSHPDDNNIQDHIQKAEYAINNLKDWLEQMRKHTVQILKAPNLQDPSINNAALQLRQLGDDAYTGRIIPPATTAQSTPESAGALQAYTEIQLIASLPLREPTS